MATSVLSWSWISFAQKSGLPIDRVELNGVLALSAQEVEEVLNFGPQPQVDRSAMLDGIEALKARYKAQGYPDATVKGGLFRERQTSGKIEVVLKLNIVEGRPLRLKEIQFQEQRPSPGDSKSAWNQFVQRVLLRSGFSAGEIVTAEKLRSLQIAVENELTSADLVGGKLLSLTQERLADAEGSSWTKILLKINPGDRVSFGFQGNTRMSRSELLDLVQSLKQSGFSEDYVETIRHKIMETYKSMAFSRVSVEVKTFERPALAERHVTYLIHEGTRTELESIAFEGNQSFSAEVLRKRLIDRGGTLLQGGYYVEDEVNKAADQAIDWIRSQGYLSAKLVSIVPSYVDAKQTRVRVVIYILEGEQTYLKQIRFEGLSVFTYEEALAAVGVEPDRPLNLFAFSEGLERLKLKYKNQGYLDVLIQNEDSDAIVQYSLKNRQAEIVINLKEGAQIRVSKITIEGYETTAEEVISRELLLKAGDVLKEDLVRQSEQNIRRLGIFSSVSVETKNEPEKIAHRSIRISVVPGSPGRIGGGLGFRNDLGIRAFTEAAYSNFWGKNHSVNLNASLNRRIEDFCKTRINQQTGVPQTACFAEYQAQITYVWPWVFWGKTTFRPDFTIEKRRYTDFDANTTALTLTLERQLWEKLHLVGALTYSVEFTRQENAVQDPDNQELTIGTIGPSLRVDFRDNPLSPTRGFYAWASFEWSAPAFGSQLQPVPVGFTRLQFRLDQHVPLTESLNLFFSFRTGFERNSIDPNDPSINPANVSRVGVPLIKQFSLGGVGSLRGYDTQEINAQNQAIQGTLSYINYRAQLELPLSGSLRFGPFLDAGNVFVDRYMFGPLKYGSGIGLRYRSPVGPINFDWGFKLDAAQNDPSWNRFYFSIGIL